jgi:hypothetical protein
MGGQWEMARGDKYKGMASGSQWEIVGITRGMASGTELGGDFRDNLKIKVKKTKKKVK